MRAKRGLAVSAMGFVLLAGCHAKGRGAASELKAQSQTDAPEASAQKVGGAAAAIAEECAKQPFDNARTGLIVSETGLREDVFDLRDRVSFKAVPFALNEAERLETLLGKAGTGVPAEQAACIEAFAEHLKSLTDPLVEADAEQKQLDVSAFDKASQEAEQETEQEQKAIAPASSKQQ